MLNKNFLNFVTHDMIVEITSKRFEYTYESMWKAVKEFLRLRGIICNSPKSCFNELIKEGLISEDYEETLSLMVKIRNLLVHIYDEESAKSLYEQLHETAILETFKKIIDCLKIDKELV